MGLYKDIGLLNFWIWNFNAFTFNIYTQSLQVKLLVYNPEHLKNSSSYKWVWVCSVRYRWWVPTSTLCLRSTNAMSHERPWPSFTAKSRLAVYSYTFPWLIFETIACVISCLGQLDSCLLRCTITWRIVHTNKQLYITPFPNETKLFSSKSFVDRLIKLV